MSKGIDLARLVDVEMYDGPEVRVGSGSKHCGLVGQVIGVIRLRHDGGYENIVQLDNGKIETFSPFSLFPAAY